MRHSTYCKICGKPMSVEVDSECPEEWIDILMPSATCDGCFSLLMRVKSCKKRIKRMCEHLSAIEKSESETAQQSRKTYRDFLASETRYYASMLTAFYEVTESHWSDKIVDAIMSKPASWEEVLRIVRDRIRKAKQTKQTEEQE